MYLNNYSTTIRKISLFFLIFLCVFLANNATAQSCKNSAKFSVSSSAPYCTGRDVTFTNNSTGTATYFIWLWDDGTKDSVTNKNAVTHKFSTAKTYNVKLIWGDGNCRDTSTTTQVVVKALTNVSVGSDKSVCGKDANFNLTGFSPSGGVWKGTGITNSGNGTFSPSTAGTGTHTLWYVFTNTDGCKDSASQKITVNANPTAAYIFATDSACSGSDVSFTNSSSPSSGLSYFWSFGDGQTSTLANPRHAFDAYGTGYSSFGVKLKVTNNNGCSDSVTKTVYVKRRPEIAFEDSINIFDPFKNCGGSISNPDFEVGLHNVTTSTHKSLITGYTVDWGDGSSTATYGSSFSSAAHTYKKLGTFTITVTATASNGCNSVKKITVVNETNPSVGITSPGSTTGCAPQKYWFKLSASNVSPSTTFTWDFGDGSSTVDWPASKGQDTIWHIFNTSSCGKSPGSCNNCFIVKVTAKNACASTQATVNNIVIYSKPVADFSVSPTTGCAGTTTFSFTNNSTKYSGNPCTANNLNYWNFGDDDTTKTQSNQEHPTYKYNRAGTFKVRLVVRNSCGYDTMYKTVIVDTVPKADFTRTLNPTTSCNAVVAIYTNKSTGGNLTYKWAVSPSSGASFVNSTSDTSKNPSIKFATVGKYIISLTAKNGCGTSVKYDTIIVKDKPSISLQSDKVYCGPKELSFSSSNTAHNPSFNANNGTITAYSWTITGATGATFKNGTSASSQNPTIEFPNAGTYTVSVTATNECGTSSAASQKITILPLPKANAGNTVNICYNKGTSIGGSPAANGGTGTYNYSWSPSTGLSASNVANPTATPATTTRYTLTVTDAKGCKDTQSVLVTVNPKLTADAGSKKFICAGGSTQIGGSTAATGGTPNYIYSWSPSTGLSATNIANPTANPTSTQKYTLTVTDSKNCTDTHSVFVIINPQVKASAGSAKTVCFGKSTQIGGSPSASNGSGTYKYAWSPKTGLDDSSKANPNANPGVTTKYILKVTDVVNGCSDTQSVTVTVLPEVIADAGTSNFICYGGSMKIGGTTAASGGSGGFSYSWSPSTGLSATNIANPTANPTSTTKYTLTVTDSKNCTDTHSVFVRVYPKLQALAGSAKTVCFGKNAQIGGSPAASGGNGSYKYAWFPKAGLDDSTKANPLANPTATTKYTLLVTDAKGCTDTQSVFVYVYPQLKASAGSAKTVCFGKNAQIGGSPTASGGSPSYSYSWSPSTGLSSATVANPTANPTVTTKYTLTVTDSKGCTDTQSVVVNVYPELIADAGSARSICLGKDTVIGGTTAASGGSGGFTYKWSPATGLNFDTIANPRANPTSTTKYILTVTDSKGCTDTSSVLVTVRPLPTAAMTGASASCLGTAQDLTVTLSGTAPWTLNYYEGNTLKTINNILSSPHKINVNPSATTKYKLLSVSDKYCTNSANDSVILNINPQPTANAGSNKNICYGDSISIGGSPSASGGTGTFTYSWSPSAGLSAANIANPVAKPGFTTKYKLIITDTKGCKDSSEVTVTVNPKITVNAGTNKTICIGESTKLGGSIVAKGGNGNFSYSWSPTTALSSATDSVPMANPASTITYKLIVTDNKGCKDSANITITVNPRPTPAINDSSAVCALSSKTYSTANKTGSIYNWTVTGGTISSGQGTNSINVSWDSGTSGTVKVVESFSGGCKDSSVKNITINPLPNANTGSNKAICKGDSTQIGGSAVSGNTYNWVSVPSGFSSSAANPIVKPLVTMEYILTETIAATGCKKTDTVKITVNPRPLPKIAGDTVVCGASTANYSVTNTSGNSYNWKVSGGNITAGSGTNSITVNWGSGTAGSVKVVESNSFSCKDSSEISVKINPLPLVDAGKDTVICVGKIAQIGTTAKTGNTYSWTSKPSGFTSTSATAQVSPTVTTTYYLTETISATGCKKLDSVKVTVNPLPQAKTGTAQTICYGDSIGIGATPVSGNNYSWTSRPAGFTSTKANPVVKPLVTTTFILTEEVGSSGCTKTDSVIITVKPLPNKPTISHNGPLCAGQTINLSTATVTGATYTWTGPNSFTSSQQNPVITNATVAMSGKYYLRIGYGGCTSPTDSAEVVVNPLPNVSAGKNDTVCIDFTPFNMSGQSPTGGWWKGTGITDSAAGTFNPKTAGAGNHNLTYFYKDSKGCLNSANKTVKVNPLPTVNAGSAETFCNTNIQTVFSGMSPTGGTWKGKGLSSNGTFTPSIAGVGTHQMVYVYKDANGCADSATKSVTVINAPVVDAGKNDTICIDNGSYSFSSFSPAGGVWKGKGITDSVKGTLDPTIADTGTHVYTYTYGSGTCRVSDQKTVRIHPLPIVNAGTDQNICISEPVLQLSGNSPAGGYWKGSGIADSVKGTFIPATAGLGNHNLVYIYQHPLTKCFNRDTVAIFVRPLPKADFSSDTVLCKNIPATFTNNSTGAQTYFWTFGDGDSSVQKDPQHAYKAIGKYKVQLIATTSFGCNDTFSYSVRVTEIPTPLFTKSVDTGCAPLPVIFTNKSTGEITKYEWDFGDSTFSNAANPGAVVYKQNPYRDTIYYITLKVSNLCGSFEFKDSVKVKPSPVAKFVTNLDSGCSPLKITFSNISTGAPNKYLWDFGNGKTSTKLNPAPQDYLTDTTDSIYHITLVAYNDCNIDTFRKSIKVKPKNVFSVFTADTTEGCAPVTVKFSDYSIGHKFLSWNLGDGNVSTAKSLTHTYKNPGTYRVYNYVNNSCSYDTSFVDIVVHPNPNVQWAASAKKVCANIPVQFTNLTANASYTHWDFGDGDTSTLNAPLHKYKAPGKYAVTLTVQTTTFSCIRSKTDTIEVLPLPDTTFAVDTTIGCRPLTVNIIKTPLPNHLYSWDFGDGNTYNSPAPTHTYLDSGKFTIRLIIQNPQGCRDTSFREITVLPRPSSSFTLVANSVCDGPSVVQFTNTSIGANGYLWDIGNGKTSQLTSPTTTYDSVGKYKVTLVSFNSYGCSDTSIQDFEIFFVPKAEFTFTPVSGCEPLAVYFTNQSLNTTGYKWYFGDGKTSTDKDPVHNYTKPGIYSVKLVSSNGTAAACKDSIVKENVITVHPKPEVDFRIAFKTDPFFDRTVNFFNTSGMAAKCFWDFGDGGTSEECETSHRYAALGKYKVRLVIETIYGCRDTIEREISVEYEKGLFVPNAFTPNSGPEDVRVFKPSGKNLKEYKLQIFSGWGELLWETDKLDANGAPLEAWDGTFQGKLQQQDVYVWKIQAVFIDGTIWEGKKYGNDFKTMGSVHLIK